MNNSVAPTTLPVRVCSMEFSWKRDPSPPLLSIDEFCLHPGESAFLEGPSGCGKSTFLSIIAGAVAGVDGTVEIAGTDLQSLRAARRDRFRADHIGMIFQVFNLLPWQSALQNVLLPCRFSARRRDRAGPDPKSTAIRLLAELGIQESTLMHAPAMTLSIGQQQRVAAARALIGAPDLVLADEPTSSLDHDTKISFVDLLTRECRASGAALLFVSHDCNLARHFDRALSFDEINGVPAPC